MSQPGRRMASSIGGPRRGRRSRFDPASARGRLGDRRPGSYARPASEPCGRRGAPARPADRSWKEGASRTAASSAPIRPSKTFRKERQMFKKFKLLLVGVVTTGLLLANIGVASAHQWCSGWPSGCYHWDKSGSMIVIRNYIYGGTQTQAEWARQDGWNKIGILYNYRVNYHTDVSVFDGNWGSTGWWGVASLEDVDFDWSCAC